MNALRRATKKVLVKLWTRLFWGWAHSREGLRYVTTRNIVPNLMSREKCRTCRFYWPRKGVCLYLQHAVSIHAERFVEGEIALVDVKSLRADEGMCGPDAVWYERKKE